MLQKYFWICPKIFLKIHNPVDTFNTFITVYSYHEVWPFFRLLELLSFSVPSSFLTSVCVTHNQSPPQTDRSTVYALLYASLNTTTLYCYNAFTITPIKPGITPCHCSTRHFNGQWHYTCLRADYNIIQNIITSL